MAKGLPWFALCPQDYLRDTRHLTNAQHGVYMRLLMHLWDTGWLPDEEPALAAMVGETPTIFRRKLWPAVSPFFMPHPLQPGAVTQKRMAADLYRAGDRFGFLIADDGSIVRTGEPVPQEARAARAAERKRIRITAAPKPAPMPETSEKLAENWQKMSDSSPHKASNSNELDLQILESESDSLPASLREAPPSRPAEPRGKRLPEGWAPSAAGMAYARDKGLDPVTTAEEFTAYWRAESGARARKVDWDSAWQVWCLKAVRHGRRPAPPVNRSLPLFSVAGGREAPRASAPPARTPAPADDPWGIQTLCNSMLGRGAKKSADKYGIPRIEFGPCFLDLTAREIAKAAKLHASEQPDWSPLVQWISDGIPAERIISSVRRVAGYRDYAPNGSLRRFDSTIRGEAVQQRGAA